MRAKTFLLAAAAAAAAVQPAVAAELPGERDIGHRSSAFAGATLRIGLDRHRPETRRPRLALGVSRVHERLDSSARVARFQTPGIELGLSAGRPQLLIGGESVESRQQRLGITTTHALLAAAGIAVAVLAVMELTDDGQDDGPACQQLPC